MKACQEMTTCHKGTEADTEKIEPNPRMMQSVEEHQEIPKGEATVMPVGGLRKQHIDQNLAAECHQKPKGRIQASCESRRRLTVTSRKMTRSARLTWHRRNVIRKIVDSGVNWPPPAGRCPTVQEWHGERGTSTGKFRARKIVDPGVN
jgi:hypothetical protein